MQRFNLLVGAVPIRDERVLLLQRSLREKFMPGAWGIPAGKVEFGEDLEAAVEREVLEETGLRIQGLRLLGHSRFMSSKGPDELHNLQVNYLVDLASGDVQLDRASDNFEWVTTTDLSRRGLDGFTMATLRQHYPDL